MEYIGQQLNAWNCSVTLVRAQYEWLVFFSIPKLLILYKLLDSEAAPECIDRIVQEISFLCCDDETSRKSLRAQVEVSYYRTRKLYTYLHNSFSVTGK